MRTVDFNRLLETPLSEMPQHYSGPVIYMKDAKFEQCSIANAKTYVGLGTDDHLVYMVDQHQTFGYVFEEEDLVSSRQSMLPVMKVRLRETPFGQFRQAFGLRIREKYARNRIATTWYLKYVQKFGGVVSDREHLQGGKILWRSLINYTAADPTLQVQVGDWETGQILGPVTSETPDHEVWSADDTLADRVLILTTR